MKYIFKLYGMVNNNLTLFQYTYTALFILKQNKHVKW